MPSVPSNYCWGRKVFLFSRQQSAISDQLFMVSKRVCKQQSGLIGKETLIANS